MARAISAPKIAHVVRYLFVSLGMPFVRLVDSGETANLERFIPYDALKIASE